MTGSLPPRIGSAARISPWKNIFGLLLALLIAGFGFLALLRAAGVENLPGQSLIDRIPAVFSRSDASAPQLQIDALESVPAPAPAKASTDSSGVSEKALPPRLGASAKSTVKVPADTTAVGAPH